ncbi:MAG: 50S ribosomal protein L10 [Tepidisphaeraceae bacterium]|jgi:ribosomal protein L10
MSKKVKSLIEKELSGKFSELDTVAVISPRGIDGVKNNQLRRRLREKGMRMTVVKNSLARRASDKTKIKGFDKLLDGPSAVIYGKSSVSAIARLLLDEKKADEKLELRGIFFDGEIYVGDKGIQQVSKFPTREEAIALVVGAILGPGRKLAAAIKGPGGKLGGILKTLEEKGKPEGTDTKGTDPTAPAAPAVG